MHSDAEQSQFKTSQAKDKETIKIIHNIDEKQLKKHSITTVFALFLGPHD